MLLQIIVGVALVKVTVGHGHYFRFSESPIHFTYIKHYRKNITAIVWCVLLHCIGENMILYIISLLLSILTGRCLFY